MRIVGGLTGEDLSDAANPDWIIPRKHLGSPYVIPVLGYMKNIPAANYRRIVIDYPDITYENREDPAEHRFRTDTEEDKVVIYHKIR
jgi:hypothetical protein